MAYFKYGEKELTYLKSKDVTLKKAIENIGLIHREVNPNLYEGLISSIIAQQVSSKAAKTVWNRLLACVSEVTPANISTLEVETIQKLGMTMRKATYIKAISKRIVNEELNLNALNHLSDAEVIKQLKALPGIGTWTAEMLMIFSMERQDILSWDDLAIRRGLMRLYGLDTIDRKTFEMYRTLFSPYGSVASLYLWAIS